MPFGIDEPEKQQAILFVLLLLGGMYVFYQYVWSPVREERAALEDRHATLEAYNDQARAITQPSRIADLRRREAEYQVALAAYATMLPSRAEVSTLLEDVARAALTHEIQIVNFAPLEPVAGDVLVELPYDVQVQGDYHDIGRFLADVANLPRLVRPVVSSLQQVTIEPESEEELPEFDVLATLRLATFVPSIDAPNGPPVEAGETTSNTLSPAVAEREAELQDVL